jgi:hypothetical protein
MTAPRTHLLPTECDYLRSILKEHLEYYRVLASHPRTSQSTLIKLKFLETLHDKLRTHSDAGINGDN